MNRAASETAAGAAIGLLALLAVWWAAAASGRIDPVFLPAPSRVWAAVVTLAQQGALGADLAATALRAVLAWTIAVGGGVAAGLLLGMHPRWHNAVSGVLSGARSLPSIALFPAALLVIGVTEKSLVILGAFTSLLMVTIGTMHGVEQANPRRIRQAQRLGMGRTAIALRVMPWEAMDHIVSAGKIAAGFVAAVIIAGEMYLGSVTAGVGLKILDNQQHFNTPETFAYMLAAATLGIALNLAVSFAGAWLLRWQNKKPPI